MSNFSERFGYTPIKLELQDDEMPKTLRAGLWDMTRIMFFSEIGTRDFYGNIDGYSDEFDRFTRQIWFQLFRKSMDERSTHPANTLSDLKHYIETTEFFRVYEFIEFMANLDGASDSYRDACNIVLAREKSQFRFADNLLVRLTAEDELEEVSEAVGSGVHGIREHVRRAAELYSSQVEPDFRNSVKESISAVEAAVSFVTGEKPGGISRPLRKAVENIDVHPALRDGFEKLYAYTSDEGGIRHALTNETTVTQADAKYMLVSCSAFANYLVAKSLNR